MKITSTNPKRVLPSILIAILLLPLLTACGGKDVPLTVPAGAVAATWHIARRVRQRRAGQVSN